MDYLIIPGTTCSPYIAFDHECGVLIIHGNSYPLRAYEFYRNVFHWLLDYKNNPHTNTYLLVELRKINSASIQALFVMMEILLDTHKQGGTELNIEWKVQNGDVEMAETVRDLSEILTFPIHISRIEHVA